MCRPTNVLLPTDFSHYALHALNYAMALARKTGGTIHVAHVMDSSIFTVGSGHGYWLTKSDAERLLTSMHEQAETRLAHLVQMVEDEGVSAKHYVKKGKPWVEIIRLANELSCDAIIIATHGRTGFDRVIFGSVCEKIVRHAAVPVLCVKHPEHEFISRTDRTIRLQRVMFPSDFSKPSEKVLSLAASLCREFRATLVLFHANEIPAMFPEFVPDAPVGPGADMEAYAREALDRTRAGLEDLSVDIIVKTGIPYREICQTVRDSDIDLVIIPTHGRSAVAQLVFGGVTEKVVRCAPCPVLTIRPDRCPAPDLGVKGARKFCHS